MRLACVVAIVLGATAAARADQRIQSMIAPLERELAGCEVQTNGLAKVAAGATALAKAADPSERDELEKDADKLTKGHALVKEYCGEVAGLIAFLKDNAAAPYKTVEKEIDTRDNKLRKLRKDAKQQVEELAPITRKVIPRMARTPTVKSEERRVPAKFPSGRTVELPALDGTWSLSGTNTSDSAEYTDKAATASVTTRPFSAATCDQQRKALALKSDAEQLIELELGAAKDVGAAWHLRYTKRDKTTSRLVDVMCVPTKTGGVLATSTVLPAEQQKLADELAKVMVRMLAAQLPK